MIKTYIYLYLILGITSSIFCGDHEDECHSKLIQHMIIKSDDLCDEIFDYGYARESHEFWYKLGQLDAILKCLEIHKN